MIRFKAAWADTSRDFSRAADWPGRRQSVESAEWVKSHRPAPNPLYLSRGGALGMKTRLGVSYPVKKNGHCLVFVSFVSHLLKEDSDRYGKCCIRSSPTLICVTARERSVPALATAQAAAFLGASGGEKKQTCGFGERLTGRWGPPPVQKSRCRSLPKNSKILMFWPTGRLQKLLRVNNVSESTPCNPFREGSGDI